MLNYASVYIASWALSVRANCLFPEARRLTSNPAVSVRLRSPVMGSGRVKALDQQVTDG